jgi:hypothetical protein
MSILTSTKYYSSDTFFNGNVTFFKDINLLGQINLDNLYVNKLGVGVALTANHLKVGTAVTIASGVVTASNGFISAANTTPVRISLSGNRVVFTAVGIGSTSFVLA